MNPHICPSLSRSELERMPTLRLRSIAPDFKAETTKGTSGPSWLAWISYSQMTSLRHAPPNLPKSRAVPPMSRSAMSRSSVCLRTVSNRTTGGSESLTSTSGAKLTSSSLSDAPLDTPLNSPRPPQIADADQKVATLCDMLYHQDASNVDKNGLLLAVISPHARVFTLMLKLAVGRDSVCD
jgi:hypothetical protein